MRSPLRWFSPSLLAASLALMPIAAVFGWAAPAVIAQTPASAVRLGEAVRFFRQGNAQLDANQLPEALQSFEQALAIYREVGHRQGEAYSLYKLGIIHREMGQLPLSIDLFEQALAIAQEIGDRRTEANVLNGLGLSYDASAEYSQAIRMFRRSLEIKRELGDREAEGNTLGNLGQVYYALGQYQTAVEVYRQALAIDRELGDQAGQAGTLSDLGNAYFALGDYPQAIELQQQALALSRHIGDRPLEAKALNNLGLVYDAMGQYQQAIALYQQSLNIERSIGHSLGEAYSLGSLGNVYLALGNYQQSITFYQQALGILRQMGDRAGEGYALGSLGFAYDQLEDYPEAIAFYQQALAIQQTIGNRLGESNTLSGLGNAYFALADYPQAIAFHQQSLTIDRALGNRLGEANSLGSLGMVYEQLGHYTQAIEYYQRALAIEQAMGDREGEGLSLTNIGYVLASQNRPELAIVFLKQAVNQSESIRQTIQELPQDLQTSYAQSISDRYRRLADLLLQQDRVLEAQEVLDLLKLQELDDYLQTVRGNSQTAQWLDLWPPEQQIAAIYANLTTAAGEDIANFERFRTNPEVVALVQQLQRQSRGQNLNPEQLVRLQDNLRQAGHAALLYPLILDDRLELVLVTPTGLMRQTVPVGRVELNEAIARFRSDLSDRRSNPIPKAQQLYQWLIAPIADALEQAQVETILYAADGALRYIPLAALHDDQQWLIQRYSVNHITAASLTNFAPPDMAPVTILAGAFPAEGMTVDLGDRQQWFPGLPYAHIEVQDLAATLPHTVALFDADFNRAALEPQLDRYRIIHLATHAEFRSGHPSDSFILLGDGDRITLADLDQWRMPDVDLVVLSACRTAVSSRQLGNGEEILGFGYQIQRTGAAAAIASLWYVNDGSTQALMNAFYNQLEGGAHPAAALRQAQIVLIRGDRPTGSATHAPPRPNAGFGDNTGNSNTGQDEHFDHPYYWAPFILIGNGL